MLLRLFGFRGLFAGIALGCLPGMCAGQASEPATPVSLDGAMEEALPGEEAHVDLLPLFATVGEEKKQSQDQKRADDEEDRVAERYHWRGLLWQSLGFMGAENVYRLSTDQYMRHLIATGPYWRDYGISMTHWDMDRWNDGDSFVVDDIGHPMQGAVSSFIEIQNSPSARNLQFSNSRTYWKSRFIAMLWSTLYSTQQKIGPLGEAALGNSGGYTYALHCPFPCKNPEAEYTNNTGWTDFIMTPAGGTVWVIGEDLIDRYTGRWQDAHPDAVFPKIVRGALNPTRTAANALRGKNPWYRDYLHPEGRGAGGVHFERGDEEFIRSLPRYEIFPHFNAIGLTVNTATCSECRRWTNGAGVELSTRLSRWVDFDSDFDYQPNASPVASYKSGGDALIATFGFRSGFMTPHYTLKAAIRPGFVSYDRAQILPPSQLPAIPLVALTGHSSISTAPARGRITHFATALALSGDYGITRNVAVRGVFGNTPVRYLDGHLTPPGVGTPPYLNWLSKEFFETNENWTYQVGPVLRF